MRFCCRRSSPPIPCLLGFLLSLTISSSMLYPGLSHRAAYQLLPVDLPFSPHMRPCPHRIPALLSHASIVFPVRHQNNEPSFFYPTYVRYSGVCTTPTYLCGLATPPTTAEAIGFLHSPKKMPPNPRLLPNFRSKSSLKALYSQPNTSANARHRVSKQPTVTLACHSTSSHRVAQPDSMASTLKATRQILQHYSAGRISSSSSSECSSSNNNRLTTVHDLRILERILRHSDTSAALGHAEAPAGSLAAPVALSNASTGASGRGRVVLLLLNRPLPFYVNCLLENASVVVAADGAANYLLPLYRAAETKQQQAQRLHERMKGRTVDPFVAEASPLESETTVHQCGRTLQLPACICGDMDSSSAEALYFFEARGVPVVRLSDQIHTDLEKAFAFAASKFRLSHDDIVIIAGAIGGRFDHSIAAVSFLYKVHNASAETLPPKVILLGECNACLLLPEGDNEVLLSDGVFSEACGLLPMAGEVRNVTTEGLKWNVKGEPLRVGGLISSSNIRIKDRIKIATSDPLVFFGELNKELLHR